MLIPARWKAMTNVSEVTEGSILLARGRRRQYAAILLLSSIGSGISASRSSALILGPTPVAVTPATFQEQANNNEGISPIIGTGQYDLVGSNCVTLPLASCENNEAETIANGLKVQAGGTDSGESYDAIYSPANATAIITYYFEPIDTTAEFVPLVIHGFLSASAAGVDASALAEIEYSFTGGGRTKSLRVDSGEASPTYPTNFTDSPTPEDEDVFDNFMQKTSTLGMVMVYATCDADPGSCLAAADPIIQIAPSFLANNPRATLLFSANIQQPSSIGTVPEIPTWIMIAIGFATLGFAGYRTSRKGLSMAV
jgi:hypothetical protein